MARDYSSLLFSSRTTKRRNAVQLQPSQVLMRVQSCARFVRAAFCSLVATPTLQINLQGRSASIGRNKLPLSLLACTLQRARTHAIVRANENGP
jgi:hypothetical protein